MTQAEVQDKSGVVAEYLHMAGWIEEPFTRGDVRFLAAGEYNENYFVDVGLGYVLRINHGSQLDQEDQIGYEFKVLQAVAASGVTPRPLHLDSQAGERDERLGCGVLLMQYLPGAPFKYERDADNAAGVFAAVHSVPVAEDLVVQADPVGDIACESLGLLRRYDGRHPLPKEQARLLQYYEEILRLREDTQEFFANEQLVIVNTEVNSGNFIVDKNNDLLFLVDWEKAVVSSRYQDLGHFLVSTTTRWKTDFVFSREEKRQFIEAYIKAGTWKIDLEEAVCKTAILEKTILLRALSWCHMAYHEYTLALSEAGGRELVNLETFATIRMYLDEMECILTHEV